MLCSRRMLAFSLANRRIVAFGILPARLFVPRNTVFAESFSSTECSGTAAEEKSFTVSYLISSCGLSPEAALSASRSVRFRSAEQPDSVLNLLRDHGFTDSHISKLSRVCPRVLASDPYRTILPKLELFCSLGISSAQLAKVLSSNPHILRNSLENRIIPVRNFLRDVILLDDKKMRKAFRYSSWIFREDLEKSLAPKIAILKEIGVPASCLSYLFTYNSCMRSSLLQNHSRFEETVKEAIEMGVSPSKSVFIFALCLVSGLSKSTWKQKIEVYKKYGLSEDDIQQAFKLQPLFMRLSQEAIRKKMDFFVNEMGLKAAAIARAPWILLYSLENRIVPRFLVTKVLMSKGLLRKDMPISTILTVSNKSFLDKHVTKYVQDLPQLLHVFKGELDPAEFGFPSDKSCGIKQL